jgi:hypothetical protein
MFLDSFDESCERFRVLLSAVRAGRLSFADTDLDTGRRPTPGVNRLADKTYASLLEKLTKKKLVIPAALRQQPRR